MSFLTSPPEIISSLLHTGVGSGPMLAASSAWNGLAGELGSAAQSFSSLTSDLAAAAWQGPSSAAMMSTASQYTGVLSTVATQAETAAAQAQTMAGLYESAVAAAVHPAVVALNRNQLVQLVMTNLFGQNAPAIAATEAEYEQMWAQDVGAMLGYHGGASAAAAQLTSWASAIEALPGELSAAIANTPVGAAVNSVGAAVNSSPIGAALNNAEQAVANVVNAPSELLFGRPLIPTGTAAATTTTASAATTAATAATASSTTGTVPISIVNGTEPVVNVSVGSGPAQPVLIDTGSNGLVVPVKNVGGIFGLLGLGLPSGFGISGYSGGLDYVYATYNNVPVSIGGLTTTTPVDVELFSIPTSLSTLTTGFSLPSFLASDGSTGVLGLGPTSGGPGPQFVLPNGNQGVLINEAAASPYLQFGPTPTNVGTSLATFSGAPIADLNVTVNGVTTTGVTSIIDSGGVDGTIPSSVIGSAAAGSPVTVSAPDGTTLYSFTYDGGTNAYSPTVESGGLMNTGSLIYLTHPIYINYGTDQLTVFG